MKRLDPDYVAGKRPPYKIQPPIVHPPFCICARCAKTRRADEWDSAVVVRIFRASKFPTSRSKSTAYALQVKRQLEDELRKAVADADVRKIARSHAVPFGRVCDAYRADLKKKGKRLDRAEPLIVNIEALLGRDRDAAAIEWREYQELLAEVSAMSPQTQRHYADMLLAILNFGVKHRVMEGPHALGTVPRPHVETNGAPVTWTKDETRVLMIDAMNVYERDQAQWNAKIHAEKANRGLRSPSYVPLRGLCLVAYFTLMRPKNNLALTWEEVDLERGRFNLKKHKNVGRRITARGNIAPQLLDYLRSIRPRDASGPVHVNPETGRPYVDIRKQWDRLVAIASDMLGYKLEGRKADFFTFRHTGASDLAERAIRPQYIVRMMGDTNIRTVERHYFRHDLDDTENVIAGWTLRTVEREEEGQRPN